MAHMRRNAAGRMGGRWAFRLAEPCSLQQVHNSHVAHPRCSAFVHLAGAAVLFNHKSIKLPSLHPAIPAGLLLGAGLCVVLPEGFFSFVEAQVCDSVICATVRNKHAVSSLHGMQQQAGGV